MAATILDPLWEFFDDQVSESCESSYESSYDERDDYDRVENRRRSRRPKNRYSNEDKIVDVNSRSGEKNSRKKKSQNDRNLFKWRGENSSRRKGGIPPRQKNKKSSRRKNEKPPRQKKDRATRQRKGKLRGGRQPSRDSRESFSPMHSPRESFSPKTGTFKPYWDKSFSRQNHGGWNSTPRSKDTISFQGSRNSLVDLMDEDDDEDNDRYGNWNENSNRQKSPNFFSKSLNSRTASTDTYTYDSFPIRGKTIQMKNSQVSSLGINETESFESSSESESEFESESESDCSSSFRPITSQYQANSYNNSYLEKSNLQKSNLHDEPNLARVNYHQQQPYSEIGRYDGSYIESKQNQEKQRGQYQGEFQEHYIEAGNSFDKISVLPNKNVDPIPQMVPEEDGSIIEGNAKEISNPSRRAAAAGKLMCWRNNRKKKDEESDIIRENWRVYSDNPNQSREVMHVNTGNVVAKEFHDNTITSKEKEKKVKQSNHPHSYYTYEYERRTPLEVQYEEFQINSKSIGVFEGNQNSLRIEHGEVVIQIEASTVSYTDCRIRKSEIWDSNLDLPIVPGVDFVGKIDRITKKSASKSGLKKGDRVISLVKTGGNARYIKIPFEKIVKVPPKLRPEEVVCLAETYLSAFQAIHYGEPKSSRYSKKSLSGKSLLVVGALTNFGQAVVELAEIAGITLIYAPCKKKHKDQIFELGVTPLAKDEAEWMPLLKGKIDLIIDASVDTNLEVHNYYSALRENTGYYVLMGRSQDPVEAIRSESSRANNSNYSCTTLSKSKMSDQVLNYDVFEKWELDLRLCKRDLEHLMGLLGLSLISPRILDRISLHKVGKAQEILNEKRLKGFLICEPFMKSKSRAVYL